MVACCWTPCEAKSCCKSDSLTSLRGFTKIRPGTESADTAWRTAVDVKVAMTAQTLTAVANVKRQVGFEFFIIRDSLNHFFPSGTAQELAQRNAKKTLPRN